MDPGIRNRWAPVAVLVTAIFAVGACGPGPVAEASPSASATPAGPTVRPTPRPTPIPTLIATPRPTPTPSPTPVPEAVDEVAIGEPYTLVANPDNKSLSGSVEINIAGQQITETITGREIMKGDTKVGTLLVLEFEGLPVNQAALEAGATGMANRQGGTLTYEDIEGWQVAIIKGPTATTALLRLHNNLVAVIGEEPSQTIPLATSVVEANQ